MTAPSQEAVSAIPDAEVRELEPCPFCGSRDVAQGASRGFISVWCRCGAQGPRVAFPEDCIDPHVPILKCFEAWNRHASRPTREEIRDEALEERIREDERDRLFTLYENDPAQFDALVRDDALKAARLRAALRSRTPAPSRNQDGET